MCNGQSINAQRNLAATGLLAPAKFEQLALGIRLKRHELAENDERTDADDR
jgi:hypothetical protein